MCEVCGKQYKYFNPYQEHVALHTPMGELLIAVVLFKLKVAYQMKKRNSITRAALHHMPNSIRGQEGLVAWGVFSWLEGTEFNPPICSLTCSHL